MNNENSKTSDPHRLLLIVSDKIGLKRGDRYVVLSNLSILYTLKNIKKSYKNKMNLKYQLQHGMKSLNYLMDHILYQICKIILSIFKKNRENQEERR